MVEYVVANNTNEANGFLRENKPSHFNYYWRKFVPEGDMMVHCLIVLIHLWIFLLFAMQMFC